MKREKSDQRAHDGTIEGGTAARPARAALDCRGFLAPAFLLAAVLTASAGGVRAEEQAAGPPPPPVSVAPVLVREINQWHEFTGRVEAVETVQIRPRVSGAIESVHFTEGSEVTAGDVLFVIDPRPYQAALSRAEAELAGALAQVEPARNEARRARQLLKSNTISRELHDQKVAAEAQVRAAVQAARAAVDIAKLDLEFTEVRSPIDGRIGRALVTKGNLVEAAGTLLTTVVSLDPVYVYFETDEQAYLNSKALVRRGARNAVFVGLANEEGFPHRGVLDFVDNQLNSDTGTIRARAVFSNDSRAFTPGLFARVRLQGHEIESAMLVDEKSILTDQDRKFVYVLGDGNTAQRRDVNLGRAVEGLRIINEGLGPEDRVIVHGVQKVYFPGMPVAPQVIEMGDPPAAPASAPATAGDGGSSIDGDGGASSS